MTLKRSGAIWSNAETKNAGAFDDDGIFCGSCGKRYRLLYRIGDDIAIVRAETEPGE